MIIDADDDGKFEVNQERAYIFFKEHQDEMIKESNASVVSYYNNEISEIVSGYTDSSEKQYFLDKISDEKEIFSLLKPKQMMFPLTFDETVEEVGFLCDCDWDKENGIGIKFTNGVLSEIGPQDILLQIVSFLITDQFRNKTNHPKVGFQLENHGKHSLWYTEIVEKQCQN